MPDSSTDTLDLLETIPPPTRSPDSSTFHALFLETRRRFMMNIDNVRPHLFPSNEAILDTYIESDSFSSS